ncbi:FAD-binding oxidoreductase [Burkholderia cenocepacia]|uniref:NAD(P)/FAD-dependent oxidoreductase n=1 Tax=Burkholderia cenocepacia TaxID=95486 RepID=UPI001B9BC617|nr:FAD-binding oxidoreductase [Burkholderia cenocepacia]MBR8093162.1 FAD-binding oxidoreductase [Burkholderia cenocepacia]
MSRVINRLPNDDHTNGWSALLPGRSPRPSLVGERDFDWVIVGAGYAGLAAARRLAELRPGASIAVVDSGVVGENASGRNSGFAIDLPHAPSTSAASVEQGRRAIRVGRYALAELERLIQDHRIECDWERRGRYHAAVTSEIAVKVLDTYASNLRAWGEPFDPLTRDELEGRLGTRYYHSAIYTPGTCLMNPAALVRGLADSLPPEVELFENSPVVEVEFDGPSPFIRTATGRIRFGKLILAVNAFSASFGIFQDRQIPVLLFASLTKPLTPAQQARLGTDASWGITPAHGVAGSTLRLTADRRLLIRQGFDYSPSLNTNEARRDAARAKHMELLERRFAHLGGTLDIEHFWMGWLAVSHNHAPAFGQISDNVYAAACCNGAGIVRHTAAGMLIAELANGQRSELTDDFLIQGTASYIPPRPIRDIGVRLTLMRERASGRHEI